MVNWPRWIWSTVALRSFAGVSRWMNLAIASPPTQLQSPPVMLQLMLGLLPATPPQLWRTRCAPFQLPPLPSALRRTRHLLKWLAWAKRLVAPSQSQPVPAAGLLAPGSQTRPRSSTVPRSMNSWRLDDQESFQRVLAIGHDILLLARPCDWKSDHACCPFARLRPELHRPAIQFNGFQRKR